MPKFDLIVKNVRLVRPNHPTVDTLDIGIEDGKFSTIEPNLSTNDSQEIFDGEGLLAFPGVVDPHVHFGIYRAMDADARSESQAAAAGGVTTVINYLRTGSHYLERGGPYRDYFPAVLGLLDGNSFVDYGYHLAPMSREHIGEMAMLLREYGVASFKNFMFYGGHSPHGRSRDQNKFLMIPAHERYDFAHLEFIMREIARLQAEHPESAGGISLSLHCEVADLLAAYTTIYEQGTDVSALQAYSDAHPPHSEGLAVAIAAYLAHETGCRNINLLHLSSRKAVEAGLAMRKLFPEINIGLEVLLLHLLLDTDAAAGALAKVNPPVRPRADVEFLWNALLDRKIDWLGTDHAECPAPVKSDPHDPDDVWLTKAGFGSIEYLLPGLFSEGNKRGMSYAHMAELLCWNPAQRFGLFSKGDVAPGYDADLVLLDPNASWIIHAENSKSAQGYTPFEGIELTGRVKRTLLRGACIYGDGKVLGEARGRYLKRPTPQNQ